MYDVTRRETFDDLERVWMAEVELYANIEAAVKMVVANKVDLVSRWLAIMVRCDAIRACSKSDTVSCIAW